MVGARTRRAEGHASLLSERHEPRINLGQGYVCEIDTIGPDDWHELMPQFDDASFFQTWAFGAVHSGDTHLRHIVLKKDGEVVSMAQARIAGVPGLPLGIAYIGNGPMWRRKGDSPVIGHLRNMIRALHGEYVSRRRYFLRIIPNLFDTIENEPLRDVFREEGFTHGAFPGETVVLDLSPSLEDIRGHLGRKWRQTLQSAEKKGLRIEEGADEALCETALHIYREMKERKRFCSEGQCEAIEANRRLPERLKLHVMICAHDDAPIAALACVAFGSTGLPLVAATTRRALDLDAAYVLWWKMIEYYKTHGYSAFDAGGVSEQRNPGGYYFKTHILGKGFKEPHRKLGQFDACKNPSSELLFKTIAAIKDKGREMRLCLARRGLPGRFRTRCDT